MHQPIAPNSPLVFAPAPQQPMPPGKPLPIPCWAHTLSSSPSLKVTQRMLVSHHTEFAPIHPPGNKTCICMIYSTLTVRCSLLSTCSSATYTSGHYFANLTPVNKRTVLVSHHTESPPTDHQHGQTILIKSSKLIYINLLNRFKSIT